MKPVDQIELHQPPEQIGDCMRACVASILGVDAGELPHFARAHYDHGLSHESVEAIRRMVLRDRYGLDVLRIDAQCSPEWLPRAYCVATGKSPRLAGVYHDVIWLMDPEGGRMVFDPHPSRAGIIGWPEQFTFFVPLQVSA